MGRYSFGEVSSSSFTECLSLRRAPGTRLRSTLLALALGRFLFAVSPASAGAGGISGAVTNSEGSGLSGICVFVDGASSSGSALTDVFGRYTVGPLYTGKYTLRFNDCGHHNVAIRWFKNAASYRKAKPVKVKYGVTTTGIDVKLPLTGKVVVKGPKRAKKGRKAVYRVAYKDTAESSPYRVKLEVKGKGVRFKRNSGKIQPGANKTVKAKLRFRKSGKIKLRFRVSSVTGGGVKTVKKWVRVRA